MASLNTIMDMVYSDKNLKNAIRALKDEFHPSRLILFGSRAQGKATKDSDYDFVMVIPGHNENQLEDIRRARRLLVKSGLDADVFIYSQSEFDDWKEEFSSIPEIAVSTGYEINLNE